MSALTIYKDGAVVPTTTKKGVVEFMDAQVDLLESTTEEIQRSRYIRIFSGVGIAGYAGISLIAFSPVLLAAGVASGVGVALSGLPWKAITRRFGHVTQPDVVAEVDELYEEMSPVQKAQYILCCADLLRAPMLTVLEGLSTDEQEQRMRTARRVLMSPAFTEFLADPFDFTMVNGTQQLVSDFLNLMSLGIVTQPDVTGDGPTEIEIEVLGDAPAHTHESGVSYSKPDKMPSAMWHKFQALADQGFPIHLVLDSAINYFIGGSQSGKTTLFAMVSAMRKVCGYEINYITTDEPPVLPWTSCVYGSDELAIAGLVDLTEQVSSAPDHSLSCKAYGIDEMWRLNDANGDVVSESINRLLQKGNKTWACFDVLTQNSTTQGTGAKGKSQSFHGSAFKIEAHQSVNSNGRLIPSGCYTLTYPKNLGGAEVSLTMPAFLANSSDPLTAFCEFIGLDVPDAVPEPLEMPTKAAASPVLSKSLQGVLSHLQSHPEGLSVTKIKKGVGGIRKAADLQPLLDAGLVVAKPGGYNDSLLYAPV